MARGAAPELVMKLILGRGLRLALLGTVLGLAAALGLARLMTSLLFGVNAADPATFSGVAILLVGRRDGSVLPPGTLGDARGSDGSVAARVS